MTPRKTPARVSAGEAALALTAYGLSSCRKNTTRASAGPAQRPWRGYDPLTPGPRACQPGCCGHVREFAGAKRAALAAHRSQTRPMSAGRAPNAFWILTRLPLPLFRLLLGKEWFTEPGAAPGPRKTRVLYPRAGFGAG